MHHYPSFTGASSVSRSLSHCTATLIRAALIFLLVLIACRMCSGTQGAATPQTSPSIVMTPSIGPPTTTLLVAGSGFDPYAIVDIYFDRSDLASVVTDGAGRLIGGSVNGASITVPASAVPGTHWITAIERMRVNFAQGQFLVRTDWAQFHFSPDHKGVNPYENVLSPATVGNLVLSWSHYGMSTGSSPAVFDGMLYVSSFYSLYAMKAGNGTILWNKWTGGYFDASPAAAKGLVFVTAGYWTGAVYAFNAKTGQLVWEGTLSGIPTSPTYDSGVVYVADDQSALAFDATGGGLLWITRGTCGSYSTPAVSKGAVYFGSYCGVTYALDASTGALLWSYAAGNAGVSSPAVANGVVYVGGDGNLYALDAVTGTLKWQYPTSGSSPAVANGVVYIGSDDGNLYALDAGTGALIWQYPTSGFIESSPAVANGVVYVGSEDWNVYALNASTGALLWQYRADVPIDLASAAVANGMLYIGSTYGFYAFGLPSNQMSQDFAPPQRPDPKLLVPDYSLQPITSLTVPNSQHSN